MDKFTKISQKNSQYLVYNTGYTSRLAKKNGFIKYTFDRLLEIYTGIPTELSSKKDTEKIKDFFKLNHNFNTNKVNMEMDIEIANSEFSDFKRSNPVYIYDSLWGDGFYIHKYLDLSLHINNIFQIHSMMNDDGYIVFINKTFGFDYVNWLEKQDYCCLYGIMNPSANIIIDNTNNFSITVYDIDSESG